MHEPGYGRLMAAFAALPDYRRLLLCLLAVKGLADRFGFVGIKGSIPISPKGQWPR